MKGRGLGQPAQASRDPAAMQMCELSRLGDRAARWHGQDRFAVGRVNAQGVTARAPVSPQPDCEKLGAVPDDKSRGFVRPPIKEGACSHVGKSGEEKLTPILPYPPPGKSLGTKTNHLPNIQGLVARKALQNGPKNEKFDESRGLQGVRRTEAILTLSRGANLHFFASQQGARSGWQSRCSCGGGRNDAAYSAASASIDFGLAADIMKSLMRGTISDLKREPLNTP